MNILPPHPIFALPATLVDQGILQKHTIPDYAAIPKSCESMCYGNDLLKIIALKLVLKNRICARVLLLQFPIYNFRCLYHCRVPVQPLLNF